MIAVWMSYCVGIGLAFVVVGHALERGLHLAGRATRWAWVIALFGSYLVPAAAWLRPQAFATFAAPIPVMVESGVSSLATTSTTSTILHEPPPSAFSLRDLDSPLVWAWGLASVAMLFVVGVAAARLVSHRRRWRQAAVDGRLVFVSTNIGPAVVGVWGPRVVLPEWALALPAQERELMLAHEEQHVRARDPAVLAAAFLAVLLAPWNLALWWQWRRLCLAVEIDCDARVLAQGRSAAAYGELLLHVGRRRTPRLVGAAAFGEPLSFLESRIRRMASRLPRWRWAGAGVAAGVAAGAIIGACQTPRPLAPGSVAVQQTGEVVVRHGGVSSDDVRPLLSRYLGPDPRRLADSAVIAWFVVDQSGRVVAWGTAPRTPEDSVLAAPVTAARVIPSYDTLRVEAVLLHAEHELPPTVVVRLGERGSRSSAPEMMDRMSIKEAQRLRPWVESNARRMFPSILDPSGPPAEAFLVHDARLQVYRGTLTTLDYLGQSGGRPNRDIAVTDLKRAFPAFDPGHDGWGVVDARGLKGLVRDNVRVIRIHHDPQPQDTAQGTRGPVDTAEVIRRAEQVRRLARQYHPEVFGRGTAPTAVALVIDARGAVLGHAARPRDRGANIRTADGVAEDCLGVLTRLVPEFKGAQWTQAGCTNDPQPNVIVYWGIPLGR